MAEVKKIKSKLTSDIDALRAKQGFLNAGIPNYNHMFGRDACVSALQLMDYDRTIAKSTLLSMAKYQAKWSGLRNEAYRGKMPHEHFPGGLKQKYLSLINDTDKFRKLYILLLWRFPYYGRIDSGAWFIILLHRYYKKTGEEDFVRTMWPKALRVMRWVEKRAAKNNLGLVAYKRSYMFGLRSQSWKDAIGNSIGPPVAMVEVQGYYYEAYNSMAELAAEVLKDEITAKRFIANAEKIKKSFNDYFINEQENYLSMAVSIKGGRDYSVASNPGHLLFTGILDEQQTKNVVERLMDKDMLTPFGIRTLSAKDESFDAGSYQEGSAWPFDNWVIYQGLLKNGYHKEADVIKHGLFSAFEKLGEIPELYTVSVKNHELGRYPEACNIQAWSAGALMNMITMTKPVL